MKPQKYIKEIVWENMNSYEETRGVTAGIQFSEKLVLVLGFQHCDKTDSCWLSYTVGTFMAN